MPRTKEKRGLLHICIGNIHLGYSEPLGQAFSVGHINPKGRKFIERPEKNLPLFMYKAEMHTVYVYSYTYICGIKISWGRAIRKKCLKRLLRWAVMKKKDSETLPHPNASRANNTQQVLSVSHALETLPSTLLLQSSFICGHLSDRHYSSPRYRGEN